MKDLTNLLIHYVEEKTPEPKRRMAFSRLSGVVGIIGNLLLSSLKFLVGALTGSVSVTADAVNNLTDCVVNIVTVVGTRISQRPDDKEHPFGHGRIEYISALLIAFSIFVVSFELGKESVIKIFHPEDMSFRLWYLGVLMVSVLVKLWMAVFNGRLYQKTQNPNLKAVRQDSLNDCLATISVMVGLGLTQLLQWKRIDGIIGLGVSVFILYSGIGILKEVASPLLGEAPPKEITGRIEEIICESRIVLGVHDLVIHNYGADRVLASADAEVDARADIFAIHDAIDRAEHRILEEMNIVICIHMDPVDRKDKEMKRYRAIARKILLEYDPDFTFHDLKVNETQEGRLLRLEVQVPMEKMSGADTIRRDLEKRFEKQCPECRTQILVEHSLV